MLKIKLKVKFTLEQATKAHRGSSFTLSLTSALDGVGGQRHAPAGLPSGKTQYTLYTRLSIPQGRSGQVLEISPLPAFDPRTVQPVVSRCTDCAVPAHQMNTCVVCYLYVIVFLY